MKRQKQQLGFSMIELMLVLVIGLVITAMATPSVARAMNSMQLRSAASSVSGMLQRTRIIAVKTNTIVEARATVLNGANTTYVDIDSNGNYRNTADGRCPDSSSNGCREPLVQFSNQVTLNPAAPPPTAFPVQQLLGTPTNNSLTFNPFLIAFNQRGVPCNPAPVVAPVNCPNDPLGRAYLYYMNISGAFGTSWAAITITPAGRIRVWILNGNQWN